jgi:preprotein translocase subunit SecE
MAKVNEYIKESYEELTQKVTWPTWTELWNSAILVIIAAFIIALVVLIMDQSIHFLFNQFYTSLS